LFQRIGGIVIDAYQERFKIHGGLRLFRLKMEFRLSVLKLHQPFIQELTTFEEFVNKNGVFKPRLRLSLSLSKQKLKMGAVTGLWG
jgi:hypothetical protein